ncbi:MAG: methionine--tRNA ligase [Sedimentisphaerales bacterium]|nr:methionine--tRNA ligase [Sedimentisphaerales bacterium]
MPRKIVVTSALYYSNGPIHMGHLVESIQTDLWVRFQKMLGNNCLYFCADDTHGTAIMISARKEGITPEQLIDRAYKEHLTDLKRFLVEFDNYYTTHSPENRTLSELFFARLRDAGSITKRNIDQTWCPKCNMALPDRFIRGACPKCKAEDQYGDSCEVCGSTYQPTDLINPRCANCGTAPVLKQSEHYFFKLADYEKQLREIFARGYIQESVSNKLDEWFRAGLKDWDISRDGPYFGFKIPGEEDKYFYVWLDAPIGYMASAKNYCDKNNLDFNTIWNSPEYELYHFIGKDIMYFHALFWPAMLVGAGFKTANKLFVHGFLTVNGQKMSKSRGTFINASTYLNHLDPEYLRYYYASKLAGGIDDIDLSIGDFVNKINSDLVGKFANLASRAAPMLKNKLSGRLGRLDEQGRKLVETLAAAAPQVIQQYEQLNYAALVRTIVGLSDLADQYIEQHQPWNEIKNEPERARTTLTTALNALRILTIYLKPVIPRFAENVERLLGVNNLTFADVGTILEEHNINDFVRLFERVTKEQVDAMIEESKETGEKKTMTAEPIKPECTIEDFAKIDLRIATVTQAERVEGADKLLRLQLDVGGVTKSVMAAITLAYKPETLVGKTVIYFANLKPRQMRFGLSEGMILASGTGGTDIYLLTADAGATPGQKVS